ncbi:hypothetical protein PDUR_22355 [Paenibacillus durus]|uniref:SbsA Ig-like domain-containing protein n=2 Tax=Paenibacillus durus TaxID=44251 RepID=A0A089IZE8_PAEDU|nr:hypothetical protein PDUR_22355 [Paenibacillus durus]
MALLLSNLVAVSTAYGAALAINGAYLAPGTTKMGDNETDNLNAALQPVIKFNFGKGVTGETTWADNQSRFQLVKYSDSTVIPIIVSKGDSSGFTNKDIAVTPASSLEYATTYKIICAAGVKSNNGDSTASDKVYYFTTIDQPSNPTLSSATLSGSTLQLDGLASIGKDMEYYIDASGTADINSVSVTDWVYMNTVTDSTYSIALTNPNLTVGTSKVYVHFKGDTNNAPAWAIVKGGFGTDIPIAQGSTYAFDRNINISVPVLIPASDDANPTIHLRNAGSEVPSGNVMPSMQYYSRLHPSGGIYGVTANGAAPGTAIQLSLPVELNLNDIWLKDKDINDVRNNKISVYLLDQTDPNAYRWMYQKSTDRSEIANNVIKVTADVNRANQDLIFGVFYDNDAPEAITSNLVSKTDHSLTIEFQATDESDIVQFDVLRTEVILKDGIQGKYIKSTDPDKKISFTIKADQIKNTDFSHFKAIYTDNNVEKGKIYNYEIMAAEDSLGARRGTGLGGINYTPDSDEEIVQRIKKDILSPGSDYHLSFASSDSADSVTQDLISSLPGWMIQGSEIKWISSRPDIISDTFLKVNKTAVTDPETVILTAKIKYGNASDSSIVVPVTVRWTAEAIVDSVDELKAAIHSDQVTTILSRNFSVPSGEDLTLDFKGKTLKPAPTVPDYIPGGLSTVFINGSNSPDSKLTISNVNIDISGKSIQKIFYASGPVTLNNVKVIGSENSYYSVYAVNNNNVAIMNSSFAPVKTSNIWSEKREGIEAPILHISGSTFDGGGNPGYGIYSAGLTTLENNSFKNYHASDNSSAGIFIDNASDASIIGNTVTGSDIGIKIAAATAGVSSSKINSVSVKNGESAQAAANSLLKDGNNVGVNQYSVVITDKTTGSEVYKLSAFPFIPGSFAPAAGAVNVPLDSAIQFVFTGKEGVKIDQSAIDGNITLNADGAVVPASVSIDPATNIVTIAPANKLLYGTTYTVSISKNIADVSGKNMPMDIGWKFTTVPFATFLNPAASTPWDVEVDEALKIGFSEPINPDSISAGQSVALQLVGGEAAPFKYELRADGKLLTVTPTQKLVPGGQYKLTLSSPLTDTKGNTIGSPQSITFLTQSGSVAETPVITELGGSSSPVADLKAGRNYSFDIDIKNNSSSLDSYTVYVIGRAGKGARQEHGGKVILSGFANLTIASLSSRITNIPTFTVPSDATDVYFDVFVCDTSSKHILAKPVHFAYKVQR